MLNAMRRCRRQRGVPGILAENATEYVLHDRTNASELKLGHRFHCKYIPMNKLIDIEPQFALNHRRPCMRKEFQGLKLGFAGSVSDRRQGSAIGIRGKLGIHELEIPF